jgi:DNA repair protein RadC
MKVREYTNYRIRDMAVSERPREKLAQYGAADLSNAELLAILLRVGVEGENAVQLATNLLLEFGGLRGLYHTPYSKLCQRRGIGPAKAAQLMAALELGRKFSLVDKAVQSVHSPQDVYDLMGDALSLLEQEEMWILYLDVRNQIIEKEMIYRGTANSASIRVGELFKGAVRCNANGVILIHNHPSGDPSPSGEDIALTKSAMQAGKLLDIEVVDHVVIGRGRFKSIKGII